MRKLLNAVADSTTDLQVKFVLRDWATVADPKAVVVQDMIEEDYGLRLSLDSVQKLMSSIPKDHVKHLRDRAIIALGVGAGLRISEIVKLTTKDVCSTKNEMGQRGIRIRDSKHGKTRIVVLDGASSWVFQEYMNFSSDFYPESRAILGVKPVRNGYVSYGKSLSANNAAAIYNSETGYKALYNGKMVHITSHDLRRTYAYLSKRSGMSWEALRLNLGHSSVQVTERYVGTDVNWDERIPSWNIYL